MINAHDSLSARSQPPDPVGPDRRKGVVGQGSRSTPPCRTTRSILHSGGSVRPTESSAGAAPVAAPTRVVVVDDHEGFRSTACALLEARGYRVVGGAECAAAALEAVASLCP